MAAAIGWGGAAFLVGLFNLIRPGYGQMFLDVLASVYPLYDGSATITSILLLTACAFLDGAIGGCIMAVLYNFCSCCCRKNETENKS